MTDATLAEIEQNVTRLSRGDEAARETLLDLTHDRLVRLTRKMLRGFPTVRRWEETDDVWQNAGLRLWKSLADVQIENTRHFFRLAALQIRRELIELARHYGGPQGIGAHHATAPDINESDATPHVAHDPADDTHEATRLAAWTELHECVEKLPAEAREVFELLWYHGLRQSEAAQLIGISERTVKRRWQAARLALYEKLNHELPT